MQRPLKITSRDFSLNEGLESQIRERVTALEGYFDRIGGCEVTVRAPAIKHHRKGGPFFVGIRLTLPGKEIAVEHQAEEELPVAIREAFDAARRQLQDYVRETRGSVKTHEASTVGRVIRLEPALDYGFLETPDGREIYFHRNSVVGSGFDKLVAGVQVRFSEEEGDRGPQASSVIVMDKHAL